MSYDRFFIELPSHSIRLSVPSGAGAIVTGIGGDPPTKIGRGVCAVRTNSVLHLIFSDPNARRHMSGRLGAVSAPPDCRGARDRYSTRRRASMSDEMGWPIRRYDAVLRDAKCFDGPAGSRIWLAVTGLGSELPPLSASRPPGGTCSGRYI